MKLSTIIVSVPVAAVAIVVALANRQSVSFSLDPFSATTPAVVLEMPLYLLLFLTLFAGVLLGGLVAGLRRGARRGTAFGRSLSMFRAKGPKIPS